jgi:hypothetical protein
MIGAWLSGSDRLTGGELLLFQRAYQTRSCGLTGMRTRVTDGTPARNPAATAVAPSRDTRLLGGLTSISMPTVPAETSRCYLHQDSVS